MPIVQETGWAPWPVWTSAENLTHTGIRSPDRPAHSELLYRLRYPGPHTNANTDNNTNITTINNNLTVEIQLKWNVNTEVMPVIMETAGSISVTQKNLSNVCGKYDVKELRNKDTAHVAHNVLK